MYICARTCFEMHTSRVVKWLRRRRRVYARRVQAPACGKLHAFLSLPNHQPASKHVAPFQLYFSKFHAPALCPHATNRLPRPPLFLLAATSLFSQRSSPPPCSAPRSAKREAAPALCRVNSVTNQLAARQHLVSLPLRCPSPPSEPRSPLPVSTKFAAPFGVTKPQSPCRASISSINICALRPTWTNLINNNLISQLLCGQAP